MGRRSARLRPMCSGLSVTTIEQPSGAVVRPADNSQSDFDAACCHSCIRDRLPRCRSLRDHRRMTKQRTDIEAETEQLAADIRARRHAKELDVHEAAAEMAVVGLGNPQALRRALRLRRITITDSTGELIYRIGRKGKPWIIPVVDVAHAIVLMRRGMTFGGWWSVDMQVEMQGTVPALRCAGMPPVSGLDPTPGLDALRGALRDVFGAMLAAVDASALDDMAPDAADGAPPDG